MGEFELTAQEARDLADTLNAYYSVRGLVKFIPDCTYGRVAHDVERSLPIQILFDAPDARYAVDITDNEAIEMLYAVAKRTSERQDALLRKLKGFADILCKEEG